MIFKKYYTFIMSGILLSLHLSFVACNFENGKQFIDGPTLRGMTNTNNDLGGTINIVNKIGQYSAGQEIRNFYNEHRNKIEITHNGSIQNVDFINSSKITIEADNSYKVTITLNPQANEADQLHLVAHGIERLRRAIAIKEYIESYPQASPISLSFIQEILYNEERENTHHNQMSMTEQYFVTALYFHSRYYAYALNQKLQEEIDALDQDETTNLALSDDLANNLENMLEHVLLEANNKSLFTSPRDISRYQDEIKTTVDQNEDIQTFIYETLRNANEGRLATGDIHI